MKDSLLLAHGVFMHPVNSLHHAILWEKINNNTHEYIWVKCYNSISVRLWIPLYSLRYTNGIFLTPLPRELTHIQVSDDAKKHRHMSLSRAVLNVALRTPIAPPFAAQSPCEKLHAPTSFLPQVLGGESTLVLHYLLPPRGRWLQVATREAWPPPDCRWPAGTLALIGPRTPGARGVELEHLIGDNLEHLRVP